MMLPDSTSGISIQRIHRAEPGSSSIMNIKISIFHLIFKVFLAPPAALAPIFNHFNSRKRMRADGSRLQRAAPWPFAHFDSLYLLIFAMLSILMVDFIN
jgi:hypothetical protein